MNQSLSTLPLEDLCQIAAAGGGLTIDASKFTAEQLAVLAKSLDDAAQLTLRNVHHLAAEDLVSITNQTSENGSIVFED